MCSLMNTQGFFDSCNSTKSDSIILKSQLTISDYVCIPN